MHRHPLDAVEMHHLRSDTQRPRSCEAGATAALLADGANGVGPLGGGPPSGCSCLLDRDWLAEPSSWLVHARHTHESPGQSWCLQELP
jgi:hypothetical protein